MREITTRGKYYNLDRSLLLAEVAAHYDGPRGPGDMPVSRAQRNVAAIIAPTSPYLHCGDCLAWAYKEIAEAPLPDVYVIVASTQSPDSGIGTDTWLTPIDFVRIDQELAKAIAIKGTIAIDNALHERDHQIEVQLPFLQHAKYQELEHIKILPIIVGTTIDVHQLAMDITEALIDLKRTPVYIAATNFTQFGPSFHNILVGDDPPKIASDLDHGAIDVITSIDPKAFHEYCATNGVNIPGTRAIELLLHLTNKSNARLLRYYTSSDILADYKNVAAYAAITFERSAN